MLRKTMILLILNSQFLIFNSFSQSQFQVAIGGTGNDYANSMVQTPDGGYVLAGGTNSFGAGSHDMYIVKLDSSGTLQWTKTIGGTNYDAARSIIRTTDGGFAVAGVTYSFGAGNSDFYIVKLDAAGTLQWSSAVGGTFIDDAYSILQTTDGGYIVAGLTNSFGAGSYDIYIIKLDASGTFQWSKTVGGTNPDYAYSVIKTTDGGYAVVGQTYSFGAVGGDMYIVKLDGSFSLQWSRTAGGTGEDGANSIVQTTDGGYVLAGYTSSFGPGDVAGGNESYLVKINNSGTFEWSRVITSGIAAEFIIADGNSNVYVAGAGDGNMVVFKLGENGVQWIRSIGGASTDYANTIVLTTAGNCAIVGSTESFGAGSEDMNLVKLDAGGNTCGNSTSPSSSSGTGGTSTSPTPTVTSQTPTITFPFSPIGTGGTLTPICVIGIQSISNEIPASFELFQNYPNPFNPVTIINFQLPINNYVKLTIYDIRGREVATLVNEQIKHGTYEVEWNASDFSSGVYYCKLTAGEYSETKKMILIK